MCIRDRYVEPVKYGNFSCFWNILKANSLLTRTTVIDDWCIFPLELAMYSLHVEVRINERFVVTQHFKSITYNAVSYTHLDVYKRQVSYLHTLEGYNFKIVYILINMSKYFVLKVK